MTITYRDILASPNRKSCEIFSHGLTIEFVSVFQLSVIDHNCRSYGPFGGRKQFVPESNKAFVKRNYA